MKRDDQGQDAQLEGWRESLKKNYQLILDQTLAEIRQKGDLPQLLLHSCCGPCSSYVLEYLSRYFEITVFYYNPNIYPAEEYYFREREQENLIRRMDKVNPIHFRRAAYHPEEYDFLVKGHEKDPERGDRCTLCYRLRLEETAKEAKKGGFEYFTTTLSLSPHKDAQRLNAIGGELAEQYGVQYLYSDFKKRNGYKRSIELSEQYHMYRQDYCGCLYSLRNRQS